MCHSVQSVVPAHRHLTVVDGHVSVVLRRVHLACPGVSQSIGTGQVGLSRRRVVPVLDTNEELRQLGQLSVNDQHAEQTVETCVGEVVVIPVVSTYR